MQEAPGEARGQTWTLSLVVSAINKSPFESNSTRFGPHRLIESLPAIPVPTTVVQFPGDSEKHCCTRWLYVSATKKSAVTQTKKMVKNAKATAIAETPRAIARNSEQRGNTWDDNTGGTSSCCCGSESGCVSGHVLRHVSERRCWYPPHLFRSTVHVHMVRVISWLRVLCSGFGGATVLAIIRFCVDTKKK